MCCCFFAPATIDTTQDEYASVLNTCDPSATSANVFSPHRQASCAIHTYTSVCTPRTIHHSEHTPCSAGAASVSSGAEPSSTACTFTSWICVDSSASAPPSSHSARTCAADNAHATVTMYTFAMRKPSHCVHPACRLTMEDGAWPAGRSRVPNES